MQRVLLALMVALSAAGVPRARAQEGSQPSPPPTFAAEVELVTVDVVVVDEATGAPVRGLRREDFALSEDGRRQAIATFEPIEVSAAGAPVAAIQARVATNTAPLTRTGRTFVIVFDGLHLSPQGALAAREAIRQFVERELGDSDQVMLVATQSATWLSTRVGAGRQALLAAVEKQQGVMASELDLDYMSDYEALRIDEYKDVPTAMRVTRRWRESGHLPPRHEEESDTERRGATSVDLLVGGRARELRRQAASRQRTTLDALRRVIESLATIRGRKSVILLSEGFVFDMGVTEYREVNLASRRANAAIYFIDARGLEGLSEVLSASWRSGIDPRDAYDFMAERSLASDGAQSLALDSGGFPIRSGNDLAGGMARIARESQAYYLLGYYPERPKRDGKFHPIKVEVNRKDVELRARRGYYAPGKRAGNQGDKPFQAALDSPFDIGDVPLRMSTHAFDQTAPGKVRVVVLTEVDVSAFRFETRDDRLHDALQTLLIVAGRGSEAPARDEQRIDLKFREETRAYMATHGFPIRRELELAPGEYQAKMVVQEANGGRMGSVSHAFSVPAPEGLRLSTPIVTDVVRPPTENSGPEAVMVARRRFASSRPLACQYEIYGAEREDASGLARVTVAHTVMLPDGTPVARGQAEVLEAAGTAIPHFLGFPLEGFEPGEYRLVLTVKDERSGHELAQVEPFEVTN